MEISRSTRVTRTVTGCNQPTYLLDATSSRHYSHEYYMSHKDYFCGEGAQYFPADQHLRSLTMTDTWTFVCSLRKRFD